MQRTEERTDDLRELCRHIDKMFMKKGLSLSEGLDVLLSLLCAKSIVNGIPKAMMFQNFLNFWDETEKECIPEELDE